MILHTHTHTHTHVRIQMDPVVKGCSCTLIESYKQDIFILYRVKITQDKHVYI